MIVDVGGLGSAEAYSVQVRKEEQMGERVEVDCVPLSEMLICNKHTGNEARKV